ncbi:ribonuclease-like [Carettochelys insculpta]|uniref:ribonuclease-like n=1 Tax=Carettochelys insculpta TaxID=44489 RepID=UPI003EB7D1BB
MAPRPTFLLTLALLGACVALTLGVPCKPLNDFFQQQHLDFPKTNATDSNAYCNTMMWDRRLYFQRTHTFLNAPSEEIGRVCEEGGLASGPNQHTSRRSFPITICSFSFWGISYTGIATTGKLVLACCRKLPVLFVKHMQDQP